MVNFKYVFFALTISGLSYAGSHQSARPIGYSWDDIRVKMATAIRQSEIFNSAYSAAQTYRDVMKDYLPDIKSCFELVKSLEAQSDDMIEIVNSTFRKNPRDPLLKELQKEEQRLWDLRTSETRRLLLLEKTAHQAVGIEVAEDANHVRIHGQTYEVSYQSDGVTLEPWTPDPNKVDVIKVDLKKIIPVSGQVSLLSHTLKNRGQNPLPLEAKPIFQVLYNENDIKVVLEPTANNKAAYKGSLEKYISAYLNDFYEGVIPTREPTKTLLEKIAPAK